MARGYTPVRDPHRTGRAPAQRDCRSPVLFQDAVVPVSTEFTDFIVLPKSVLAVHESRTQTPEERGCLSHSNILRNTINLKMFCTGFYRLKKKNVYKASFCKSSGGNKCVICKLESIKKTNRLYLTLQDKDNN